jgi:hypothetical protein
MNMSRIKGTNHRKIQEGLTVSVMAGFSFFAPGSIHIPKCDSGQKFKAGRYSVKNVLIKSRIRKHNETKQELLFLSCLLCCSVSANHMYRDYLNEMAAANHECERTCAATTNFAAKEGT